MNQQWWNKGFFTIIDENAFLQDQDNVATFLSLDELSNWIKLSFSECKLSCKLYNLQFKGIWLQDRMVSWIVLYVLG